MKDVLYGMGFALLLIGTCFGSLFFVVWLTLSEPRVMYLKDKMHYRYIDQGTLKDVDKYMLKLGIEDREVTVETDYITYKILPMEDRVWVTPGVFYTTYYRMDNEGIIHAH